MLTETQEGRQYIENVSKSIVTQISPEEMEFFDELVAEYYEDPTPPRSKDAELGFGIGGVIVAITPAAIAMVTAVISYLLTEVTDIVKDKTTENLKDIFSKDKDPEPYTKEQLKQIRKIARREAKRFGMDTATANDMSDAMVGLLHLST
jgi:hypothetical protein